MIIFLPVNVFTSDLRLYAKCPPISPQRVIPPIYLGNVCLDALGKNYQRALSQVSDRISLNQYTKSMIETYRKAIGSKIWHFCSNCATYPAENYTSSLFPQRVEDAELCTECVARHTIGDCAGDSAVDSLGKRKCPVITDGKECGLDLLHDLPTGLHLCPSGHRTLIVPPAKPKKSD